MPINSKQKGKRGELRIVHALQEYGFDAHRTAQCRGDTGEAADVEIKGFDCKLHIEVKNCNRMQLYNWIAQADRDSKAQNKGNTPIVIHKADNKPILVSMHFEDFMDMYIKSIGGVPDYESNRTETEV